MAVQESSNIRTPALNPYEKVFLEHVLVAFGMNLLVREKKLHGPQKMTPNEYRLGMYSSVLLHSVCAIVVAERAKCVIIDLVTDLARKIEKAERLGLHSNSLR
jgi:hypothetical protein